MHFSSAVLFSTLLSLTSALTVAFYWKNPGDEGAYRLPTSFEMTRNGETFLVDSEIIMDYSMAIARVTYDITTEAELEQIENVEVIFSDGNGILRPFFPIMLLRVEDEGGIDFAYYLNTTYKEVEDYRYM